MHFADSDLSRLIGLGVAGIIRKQSLSDGKNRILVEIVQRQLKAVNARANQGKRIGYNRAIGEGKIGFVEIIDRNFLPGP